MAGNQGQSTSAPITELFIKAAYTLIAGTGISE
jgi:hypothetical protein